MNENKLKPYVGVTGLTSVEEVRQTIKDFNYSGFNLQSSHIPMIGFLASFKTLYLKSTKNKRYPKIENLQKLLEECQKKVLPTIHYNSKYFEEINLSKQISDLMGKYYDKELCRTIQLNIPFPKISEIEKIKENMPELKIIFQASQNIIDNKTSNEIVEKISQYKNLINYILIDPSGGQGKEFNIDFSVELYKKMSKEFPQLLVGFAGGFSGENVSKRVCDLICRCWDTGFNIDAESGLRTKLSENYGNDLYNWKKVKKYIKDSTSILRYEMDKVIN